METALVANNADPLPLVSNGTSDCLQDASRAPKQVACVHDFSGVATENGVAHSECADA